ncbi:hypothetical protein ACFE04_028195 [Oxalis oulophora]
MNLFPCHTSIAPDQKCSRSFIYAILPTASFILLLFFIGNSFIATEYKQRLFSSAILNTTSRTADTSCKNECRRSGSESLPQGIVSNTSNLQMRPLWGNPKKNASASIGLLAIPVGIKQTQLIHKMVSKFLASEFVVMLFHYDGNVDEWKNYTWYNQAIHVSALNQTKWWFAKRFLHPDIVSEYRYIFIWDEDLGVDAFNPRKYVSIVESEGLEISQPALDVTKSEVHHLITARWKKSRVHRRAFKHGVNGTGCDNSSRTPPCTGWIEVMAPVFSRAAWRCVWYMIQNDLIHAWGLDKQLGNCAQCGDFVHLGLIVLYGSPASCNVNHADISTRKTADRV